MFAYLIGASALIAAGVIVPRVSSHTASQVRSKNPYDYR